MTRKKVVLREDFLLCLAGPSDQDIRTILIAERKKDEEESAGKLKPYTYSPAVFMHVTIASANGIQQKKFSIICFVNSHSHP